MTYVYATKADIARVSTWLERLSEGKTGLRVPTSSLRKVLLECGADQEATGRLDVQKSLKTGTNKGQASAMEQIWPDRFKYYKQRCYGFVAGYVARNDESLPKGDLRASAPIHLLGWLTMIAFGRGIVAREVVRYLEAEVQNGIDWETRRLGKDDRIKLPIWGSKDTKPNTVPVMPIGFVTFASQVIQTWMKSGAVDREQESS